MNLRFRGSPFIKIGFSLLVAIFLWSTIYLRKEAFGAWASGLMTVFFAHCLVKMWPRTIHIDDEGIWQRDVLGRKRKIPWQSVDALDHVYERGVMVAGGMVEIFHTDYHADRELFMETIDRRCGSRFLGTDLVD